MTLAFVFVECARGLATSAEEAAKRIHGVLETNVIKSGTDYDLVLKVKTANEMKFKETIAALKAVAGVSAVAVSIVYGSAENLIEIQETA